MWMEMPQTYFFYFYFMFSVYAIRSFADRLPIVRRGGAALNRTRHEDGTLTTPFGRREGGGGKSCPPLPTQPPEKKESSTQKKRRSWLSVRDATCDITVVPIWQLPPALLLTIEGPSASRLQCRGKRWLVVVLEKMKRRIATDPFFHFPPVLFF